MRIVTEDYEQTVDIGGSGDWYSVLSTVEIRLPKSIKDCTRKARAFLKSGNCSAQEAHETARELNLIRDGLSQIKPSDVVYDMNDLGKLPPWGNNVSDIVTSCANLFTTADGKELLPELVSLLSYAEYSGTNVMVG